MKDEWALAELESVGWEKFVSWQTELSRNQRVAPVPEQDQANRCPPPSVWWMGVDWTDREGGTGG
jgi:hypothetical protein